MAGDPRIAKTSTSGTPAVIQKNTRYLEGFDAHAAILFCKPNSRKTD
jgi:hypothetical protein